MSEDQVRVLRLLEYVGSRAFVEASLRNRAIKGEYRAGNVVIREAILGDFPEVITEGKRETQE